MNNDLEQFSEERLKELSSINGNINTRFCDADIEALARIALAAKQAKPEYHIVRLEINDAWGRETVLNAYESQLDASKCKDDHGGVIIPCYTTPQPVHTEQGIPDGFTEIQLIKAITWINRVRRENQNMKEARTCAELILRFLPAAPKPESE